MAATNHTRLVLRTALARTGPTRLLDSSLNAGGERPDADRRIENGTKQGTNAMLTRWVGKQRGCNDLTDASEKVLPTRDADESAALTHRQFPRVHSYVNPTMNVSAVEQHRDTSVMQIRNHRLPGTPRYAQAAPLASNVISKVSSTAGFSGRPR